MVRSSTLPVLLTLTGLTPGSSTGLEAVSLLQHQVSAEQPSYGIQNERDEAMSRWIAGMYRILRSRPNPLLNKCCNMARDHGVMPWRSWGSMNESMVGLWHSSGCNMQVGAHIPNYAVGTPFCDQSRAYVVLARPAELGANAYEDEIAAVTKVSCSEQDRKQMNDTYMGIRYTPALGEECMPENLASFSVQHGVFRGCVGKLLNISQSCTRCHANFLRGLSGMKAPYAKCFDSCFPLMTCPRLSMCAERAQQCSACVQPALFEVNKCIGGPTMNRLRMENVFEQIIRFSPR
mmetsp:Transcript_77214/g.174668  ORF Transcript_77214/g.174668 Transcript_77214/m.174668 type:complete len:291 (-) Transcript_77214:43-915(-)